MPLWLPDSLPGAFLVPLQVRVHRRVAGGAAFDSRGSHRLEHTLHLRRPPAVAKEVIYFVGNVHYIALLSSLHSRKFKQRTFLRCSSENLPFALATSSASCSFKVI